MRNLNRYFIFFLVMGVLLSSVLYFRTFLMINIIEPIVTLLWLIWRIATSIGQHIYWIILILLCLFSMLRLLPSEKDNSPAPAYNYEYRPLNRVKYWQLLIENVARGKVKAENLRNALKYLLCSIIAYIDRSYPANLEQRVTSEPTPLSVGAHRLIFPPEKMHRLPLLSHVPLWFQVRVGKYHSKDNTSISELLQWMEFVMEINNE